MGKLETCIPNNDTKTFIDSIFDLTDEDIVSLSNNEINRIFSISKQINMENTDKFFEYLDEKGHYFFKKSQIGLDEINNNNIICIFYFGLYTNLCCVENDKLATILYHMGEACYRLSYFENAIILFEEAKEIFLPDSQQYLDVLLGEGITRQSLANNGIEPQKNLEIAIKIFQYIEKIERLNSENLANLMGHEANARQTLAEIDVDSQKNFKIAIKRYQKARKIVSHNNHSLLYANLLSDEARTRLILANIDVDTQKNLEIAIKLNLKARKIFPENSTSYASSTTNEANARLILAEIDIDSQKNLEIAIELHQSARKIFLQHNQILRSAYTMTNEASTRLKLAEICGDKQKNIEKAKELYILSISILEKSNDGNRYSIALLNLNRLFVNNFRKSGDKKHLNDAKKILEDAETKTKNGELWGELIQAKLHEIKANLFEYEGKSGIEKAAREYNEAFKLTRIQYYDFMDEFNRARIDIDERAFCKLIENWKDIEKDGIFLDYYDYSIYECHLKKAVDNSGIKLEDEFRLAQKKLEEIRDRTQIKIINDRVSAYVFLMYALVDSFRNDEFYEAKKNIREAYKIFDKYDDKDGIKTCELFSEAVINNEDPQAWREILRHKDRLSCNIYRLLSEGADRKRDETGFGRIESKIDDISIKIDELKTELNTGFGRIKEKIEQGFEGENEQSLDIINRLDDTQLKLEKLAEISKRSKGKEGGSIRQFSKQILLLLENEDSEGLERFVKEVINNEESLITEINDSTMPDKEKTKAKRIIKKFKKISGKAKKETESFGKNVSYNLAAALLAEEIIKHIFPLISTAIIGVPIPSQLLELLSKAIPKK